MFVSERIFIALADQFVLKNDTVKIMGQLLSTDYNDFYPYSRYVYVELIDRHKQVVERKKIRCNDNGSFFTSILLPDKSPNGIYYVRGYSQFMRNRESQQFLMVPLYVGVMPQEQETKENIYAGFFPEGGHLVKGHVQTVGIYICNEHKMPTATKFVILNSLRDTICSGKTDANGLASISFIPDGNRYLLSTETDDKATHNFLLPETMPIPTLRAAINRERLVCYVLTDTDDKEPIDSLEIAIYHSSFGIKKLNLRKGACMADLSGCTPGLITLWLCNKAGNILAQRVLRIGCSNISTSANDTIGGSSVFVRYIPEKAGKISTALEMLNFTDELLSPVPFPETYSDSSNIQTDQNINIWLLSASNKMIGADALRADSISYKYPIEQALCISGVVRNGKRPLQNANVQIYNVQNNDAVSVNTDATGHFNATVNDFVNGSKLYIQAYNSKGKTGTFTYQLDEEDYPPVTDISYNVPFAQELTNENLAKIIEPIDTVRRHKVSEIVVNRKRPKEKPYEWVRTRNVFNYYDREFLDKHPNIMTVKDAVLYTSKVTVSNQDRSISWKSLKLQGLVPQHLKVDKMLSNDDPIVYSEIAVVVNGFKIEHGIDGILGWPITDIESIELVSPLDPRSLWHYAGYGFFDIKMRTTVRTTPVVSNGVTIQPLGIATPTEPFTWQPPTKAGTYRMIVDVVSADRNIRHVVKTITVK
ncbi:carboxypeptidase-like regulatory domain-containing protein [Prevotella sp.]|uniref:carboxypeptidase-like regulatory domain-containing protein n=1 Tax=Prevotella sp. TaxID=59823 RepID=UPI003F7D2C19